MPEENQYTTKFKNRLKIINTTTSSESIQTLINWLLFNRQKHSTSFLSILYNALEENTEGTLPLFQILHELTTEKNGRSDVYRNIIKSNEYMEKLLQMLKTFKKDDDVFDKVKEMIEQWIDMDLFDDVDISLYMNLKKILDSEEDSVHLMEDVVVEKEQVDVEENEQDVDGNVDGDNSKDILVEKEISVDIVEDMDVEKDTPKDVDLTENNEIKEEPITEAITQPVIEPITSVRVDFSILENIPYKSIPPSTFTTTCKSITQYQIPREIQMESATRYSNLISTIPNDIMEYASNKLSSNNTPHSNPLDDVLNKPKNIIQPDLSLLQNNDILDISLPDSIQEVTTLSKTITMQYEDRMSLLENLCACRCQFGAKEAAKEYFNAMGILKEIQKKKEVLEDAMELEGVDVDEIKGKVGDWKDLGGFEWFKEDVQAS